MLPPWSQLIRHGAGDAPEAQVLATNVDLVFVMVALDREVNQSRLDRELAVAWDSGARPVVVLTKTDVLAKAESADAAAAVSAGVVGAAVVSTSSRDGTGLDELQGMIGRHDTVVLLGASGVGKSTMSNRLLGEEVLLTGEVRARDHKGRHTTTARHLLPLPTGGVLIDSPGIRSLGLWDAAEGIALTFPEIEDLSGQCRFRTATTTRNRAVPSRPHWPTARWTRPGSPVGASCGPRWPTSSAAARPEPGAGPPTDGRRQASHTSP
ncbi:MAG: ribosome small subunit-dependent GTPase A [Acidimicrobiales bacterium]